MPRSRTTSPQGRHHAHSEETTQHDTGDSPAAPRTVRVAALQLNSRDRDTEGNLARALPLVEEAASRGAKIVVLPELYSSGYCFHRRLWDAAERGCEGPTAAWAQKHAKRLGCHIGVGFLEAKGKHFYDTFIIAGPSGNIVGTVRKQTPAALEAHFFRGGPSGPGTHVVTLPELDHIRVAVGICYENYLSYMAPYVRDEHADILLMPHSAPAMELLPGWVTSAFRRTLLALPQRYASALGVPVVFCNKSGSWSSPLLGLPLLGEQFFRAPYLGLSQIVDSDGTVLAPPATLENVLLIADVKLPAPCKPPPQWPLPAPVVGPVANGTPSSSAANGTPSSLTQNGAPHGKEQREKKARAASAWDFLRWMAFLQKRPKHSELADLPLIARMIFAAQETLGATTYHLSGRRAAAALRASGGAGGRAELGGSPAGSSLARALDGRWWLPLLVLAAAAALAATLSAAGGATITLSSLAGAQLRSRMHRVSQMLTMMVASAKEAVVGGSDEPKVIWTETVAGHKLQQL